MVLFRNLKKPAYNYCFLKQKFNLFWKLLQIELFSVQINTQNSEILKLPLQNFKQKPC